MKTKIQEGMETFSFTVGTRALSQALNILSKAIAANPTLPIIENVKAEIIKGELTLRATNLSLTMVKKIDCFAGEDNLIQDGSMLIPHKLMSDLLKTMPDTPALIVHETRLENRQYICKITVRVNGKKFGISTEHDVDFPKMPSVDGELISIKESELHEALTTCLATVYTSDLRPAMCGVCFDSKNNLLTVVSTNGSLLSIVTTGVVIPETGPVHESFIIPTRTADAIKANIGTSESIIEIITSRKFVQVDTDQCTIIGQLIDDRYPDYTNAVPTNLPLCVNLSATEWRSELKRAAIFADQKTNMIKHTFGNKRLELVSEDTDFGNESVQEIETDANIDLVIGFNAKLLSDLLQGITGQVRVELSEPNRAILIYPENKTCATKLLAMPVYLQ